MAWLPMDGKGEKKKSFIFFSRPGAERVGKLLSVKSSPPPVVVVVQKSQPRSLSHLPPSLLTWIIKPSRHLPPHLFPPPSSFSRDFGNPQKCAEKNLGLFYSEFFSQSCKVEQASTSYFPFSFQKATAHSASRIAIKVFYGRGVIFRLSFLLPSSSSFWSIGFWFWRLDHRRRFPFLFPHQAKKGKEEKLRHAPPTTTDKLEQKIHVKSFLFFFFFFCYKNSCTAWAFPETKKARGQKKNRWNKKYIFLRFAILVDKNKNLDYSLGFGGSTHNSGE